jgi:hypothetical protein
MQSNTEESAMNIFVLCPDGKVSTVWESIPHH